MRYWHALFVWFPLILWAGACANEDDGAAGIAEDSETGSDAEGEMEGAARDVTNPSDGQADGADGADANDGGDANTVEVLVGAGDISECDQDRDEATAALVDKIPGTVFLMGDNVYFSGTTAEYNTCFHPTWGRHKARTKPVPGNHEYGTANAAGYFGYFGAAAGDPTKGYYSYDLGSWHIVAINSNCSSIGGCQAGSAQELWLRTDLQAHPSFCTLAYWHHPLFSSGPNGDNPEMGDIWKALWDANAEVVVNGHDHTYERFGPQDKDGNLDLLTGIREFIVGTGGKLLYTFAVSKPNSLLKNDQTYGVTKFSLRNGAFDWEFVPALGGTFTDKGTAACH